MRIRQLTTASLLALPLWIGCGSHDEAPSPPPTEVTPPTPAAPELPPEEPAEEEGLREWATDMQRRAAIVIGTGELQLRPEEVANYRAQAARPILAYALSTTYFPTVGQDEGQLTVSTMFMPSGRAVHYTALRPVTDAGASQPAEDHDPVLARWDTIIRRRITQEQCAFPRLVPARLPTGVALDEWAQRDLESFGEHCQTASALLSGGGQRSRRYSIVWWTDAGGGTVSFEVQADGTPRWRDIHYDPPRSH